MIEFPVVDTHVHFWDPSRLRYPWLDDFPPLNRAFLLEDYLRALGPVAVDKMTRISPSYFPSGRT